MRKIAPASLLLLAGVTLLFGGCAGKPPPPPVPVYAEAGDLFVLEGDWWGQYWSGDTGRSGRIRLLLEGESDRAYGDVLMLSSKREEEFDAANRGGFPVNSSETLRIEFVSVDGATETVSGTLEPYRDPDCDCMVRTTFTGTVSRDAIEGTFATRGGGAYGTKHGKWKVDRREVESSE